MCEKKQVLLIGEDTFANTMLQNKFLDFNNSFALEHRP